MTDQNTAIALELTALIDLSRSYLKEWDRDEPRDDFWHYQRLVALVVENSEAILAALRTPAPAPVAVGGDVVEGLARVLSEASECPRESNQTVAGAWWWDTRHDHPANTFAHEARAADIKQASAVLTFLQAQPTASTAQPDAAVAVEQWSGSELVKRFKAALAEMPPEVGARLALGQQFNAYVCADNDEATDPDWWDYQLAVGTITDRRVVMDVEGQALAEFLEAALKLASFAAIRAGGQQL